MLLVAAGNRSHLAMVCWYPIRYHCHMQPSLLIHAARTRAGLTLRALAERAHTSHSTLAAYESGAKAPNAATLDRIIRAAGFRLEAALTPVADPDPTYSKGEELADALALAEQFPARHDQHLNAPVFGS